MISMIGENCALRVSVNVSCRKLSGPLRLPNKRKTKSVSSLSFKIHPDILAIMTSIL